MSTLYPISGCENVSRKADVIFIHGLGGDAFATWRRGEEESACWPSWLGSEFPDVGVWSLGYPASPTKWAGFRRWFSKRCSNTGHTMSLTDRASQVLDVMVQQSIGQRPILFICHSLGGLLVKQILRKAHEAVDNPRKNQVATNTRAVLFLGTPHIGAKLASLLNSLRHIFAATVSIEDLRSHDAHLRDLYDWYRNHSLPLGIKTVTYFESKRIGPWLIVEPGHAHPGVGDDPVPLDEDHLSIAKPSTSCAVVCNTARDLLRNCVLASPPVQETTAERMGERSGQPHSPVTSSMPENQLRVRATYADGKSGTHVSLNIFNAGTSPIYLAGWYSEWGDRSALISRECVRGQLPFRLQAQDTYLLVVDLGDRGFTDLKTIGIVDGSNNHYNASETETAIMVQQAERYSVLHKKPDTTELEARLRECKVDVHADIQDVPHGMRTLVIDFTNKSNIPIPLVGARIEWKYDPPRILTRHPGAAASASEISGSVNLACRANLSSPMPPGATVQFYIHPDVAGILVEMLLGDVKDKDIAVTFGTTTSFGWKASQDEIPGTIREFAQHVVDSQLNEESIGPGGMPQHSPESHDRTDQAVSSSPREEFVNWSECEDGTNVQKNTQFLVVTPITEHWYRPDESKSPADWKLRWQRLRSRFEDIIDRRRPVECMLIERRIPAFPKFSDWPDADPFGRKLIQSGGGLSLEPSVLYNPDRSPLFGTFPIHDVNGRPMSNSAGEAYGFRFGLFRQFSLSVEEADLRETLTMPGPHIFELASDGAALLYKLPSNVAVSLWRNWRHGFCRRDNADGYLWFDALFELSRQRSPGDALHSRPEAWLGNGSIVLVGQGLFPRLPDLSHFPGSMPIPHDNGYPVAWRSTLQDIARASVIAIDEILERAE